MVYLFSLARTLFCHCSLKRTLALLPCLRSAAAAAAALLAATSVCTSRSWSRRTSVRAADVAVKGKQNGRRCCCCCLCVMPEQRQTKGGRAALHSYSFSFSVFSSLRTRELCGRASGSGKVRPGVTDIHTHKRNTRRRRQQRRHTTRQDTHAHSQTNNARLTRSALLALALFRLNRRVYNFTTINQNNNQLQQKQYTKKTFKSNNK